MTQIIIKLLILVTAFFGSSFFIAIGMEIPYTKQGMLLAEIRNVSSVIFGVTGAWLALVYPKALASAEKAKNIKAANDTFYNEAQYNNDVLLGFIRTIIASIVIIAISVIIPFIKEILMQFDFFIIVRSYLRGVLFYFLVLLGIAQLYLLFSTFTQTKGALKEVKRTLAEAKTKNERSHNRRH
ncbi:hypothetical protein [Aliivibrio fischeri]|uniref:hypothetical protein n=1 Tax=Aliivibrio fischeri TaxID=668 RepID=UPI0007C5A15A|nr:hypothetical protein [Aliivibrio fischeri]